MNKRKRETQSTSISNKRQNKNFQFEFYLPDHVQLLLEALSAHLTSVDYLSLMNLINNLNHACYIDLFAVFSCLSCLKFDLKKATCLKLVNQIVDYVRPITKSANSKQREALYILFVLQELRICTLDNYMTRIENYKNNYLRKVCSKIYSTKRGIMATENYDLTVLQERIPFQNYMKAIENLKPDVENKISIADLNQGIKHVFEECTKCIDDVKNLRIIHISNQKKYNCDMDISFKQKKGPELSLDALPQTILSRIFSFIYCTKKDPELCENQLLMSEKTHECSFTKDHSALEFNQCRKFFLSMNMYRLVCKSLNESVSAICFSQTLFFINCVHEKGYAYALEKNRTMIMLLKLRLVYIQHVSHMNNKEKQIAKNIIRYFLDSKYNGTHVLFDSLFRNTFNDHHENFPLILYLSPCSRQDIVLSKFVLNLSTELITFLLNHSELKEMYNNFKPQNDYKPLFLIMKKYIIPDKMDQYHADFVSHILQTINHRDIVISLYKIQNYNFMNKNIILDKIIITSRQIYYTKPQVITFNIASYRKNGIEEGKVIETIEKNIPRAPTQCIVSFLYSLTKKCTIECLYLSCSFLWTHLNKMKLYQGLKMIRKMKHVKEIHIE